MAKPTILVCDDEEIVRESVRVVLEKDYQLVFACDGEEALKRFNAQPVDLVLLDLRMPKMDGLAVLKDLMSRRPPPRVLMLTAYHSIEVAQRATQSGAIDYLTKPFERKNLLEAVDLAGKTVRYLAGILDHPRATADHIKDCLPKFINYVLWRKVANAHRGRFEVALFERPFRADRGRLLREVIEDLGASTNGNGHEHPESDTPHRNGAACGSSGAGFAAGYDMG